MAEETPITKLARATILAMEGQKGRARDKMTIAFWFGAAQGAAVAGDNETGNWIQRVAVLLIATRGFAEVERMVREADEAKAAAKQEAV